MTLRTTNKKYLIPSNAPSSDNLHIQVPLLENSASPPSSLQGRDVRGTEVTMSRTARNADNILHGVMMTEGTVQIIIWFKIV